MPEFRKLDHLLDHLLASAYQQRNEHQKETLKGGLTIELYITAHTAQPAILHLKLSRTGIPPSAKEAETVFKHWPWELPGGPPSKFHAYKSGKEYCLTCQFPMPDVRNHWSGPPEPPEPRSESKDEGPEAPHEEAP
jgi:hypothetical protein